MAEVREITDTELWDTFVEQSQQGTIFCKTEWLKLYDFPYKIYGYFKNDTLLGGICGFEKDGFDSGYSIPVTPFQGILVMNQIDAKIQAIESMQHEVTDRLIEFLAGKYDKIKISNHYSFPDIRPFLWKGFTPSVRYTYVVDLTDKYKLEDNLEKQTRYEIKKARRDGIITLQIYMSSFDVLYDETFKRKGLERPVSREFMIKFTRLLPKVLVATKDMNMVSGTVIIRDSKRAYYIFGASSEGHISSLTLWESLPDDRTEIDLVGCNNRDIGLFKRGFGGQLKPYYAVTNV